MKPNDQLAGAVVTVGAGRGFLMDAGGTIGRIVVTAAHCLPTLPPCMNFSYTEERTYQQLLGPLHEQPSVWAECMFADPVSDIAVLGPPDNQELSDEADAYEAFTENRPVLVLKTLPVIAPWRLKSHPRVGYVLSLAGEWLECGIIQHTNLSLVNVTTEGGMSGSPIIVENEVVGLICKGGSRDAHGDGPQVRLSRCLPAWLVDILRVNQRRAKM